MSSATDPHPPEEAFWERYNERAEFPLSTVLSVLLHVAVGVIIVFGLFRLMNRGEDRTPVGVRVIDVNGGNDLTGSGMAGSGGSETPLFERENQQPLKATIDALPSPTMITEIKENLRKEFQRFDPSSNLAITDEAA